MSGADRPWEAGTEPERWAGYFDPATGLLRNLSTPPAQTAQELEHFENIHDPGHFLWLHYFHSGPQFGPAFFYVNQANAAACQQSYEYVETPRGMYSRGESPLPRGNRKV